MEELNVKVGDLVIRSSRYTKDVCEVVKVTPKGYIDINLGGGTERFSKYGEKIGRQKFEYVNIYIPREGELEKIAQKENLNKSGAIFAIIRFKTYHLKRCRK